MPVCVRTAALGPRDPATVVRAVEQLYSEELDLFSERFGDLGDAETDALLDVVIPIDRLPGSFIELLPE